MKITDYKYRWINRTDDDKTIVGVVFYEGDIVNIIVNDPLTKEDSIQSIYLRDNIVSDKVYEFEGILSKEELDAVFNKELSKDTKRMPHTAQWVKSEPTAVPKAISSI